MLSAATIIALETFVSKAITYMIRGKMMSYVMYLSCRTTDLQVYFITLDNKSKENK